MGRAFAAQHGEGGVGGEAEVLHFLMKKSDKWARNRDLETQITPGRHELWRYRYTRVRGV